MFFYIYPRIKPSSTDFGFEPLFESDLFRRRSLGDQESSQGLLWQAGESVDAVGSRAACGNH